MAHPDFDQLLNALLPFAQEMLSKHGEFFPFGAAVGADGEVSAQAAQPGDEDADAPEFIDMLTSGLRGEAQRGAIRAAGICYDARVVPPGETEKTDAIACRLEHQNGESAITFLPYRKGFLGRYKYGELFASEGDRTIFADAAEAGSV